MSTPTAGTISVIGSLSGQLPLPIHIRADIEESSWDPGSGTILPKGRWEFDFINNSTGDTYVPSLSRDAMTLICPTSSGITTSATAFHRYGAGPNAGCVLRDAIVITPRARYQNEFHNWTPWVSGTSVTGVTFTGDELFCAGSTSGSDSNDGLSLSSAKATLHGVLNAVSGNNTRVTLLDDTTINVLSGVDLMDFSSVNITRSYTGSEKPIITYNSSAGAPFIMPNDSVLEGVNIVSGTGGDGRCITCVNSARKADNIFIVDVDFSGVGSFIEDGNTASPAGFGIYGGTQTGEVSRYCLYTSNTSAINVLGVSWKEGCFSEHTIRIMGGKYCSIDYSDIFYKTTGTTPKTSLRVVAERFFGAYRSAWDGGSISVGNGDGWLTLPQYTEDVRFDCCRLNLIGEIDDNITRKLVVFETARRIVFAGCTQYRKSSKSNATITMGDRADIVGDLADIWWINCYCYNRRYNSVDPVLGVSVFEMEERADVNMSGLHLINTVIMTEADAVGAAYQDVVHRNTSPSGDGSEIFDCVFFDHPTISHDIYQDDFSYARSGSALDALGFWASGNVDGLVYINPDTVTILSGESFVTGVASNINGLFEVINPPDGYSPQINTSLSAWDAGPTQSTANLIATSANSVSVDITLPSLGITSEGTVSGSPSQTEITATATITLPSLGIVASGTNAKFPGIPSSINVYLDVPNINIEWGAATSAVSYTVEMDLASSGYSELSSGITSPLSATVTYPGVGTQRFRVYATNPNGDGDYIEGFLYTSPVTPSFMGTGRGFLGKSLLELKLSF